MGGEAPVKAPVGVVTLDQQPAGVGSASIGGCADDDDLPIGLDRHRAADGVLVEPRKPGAVRQPTVCERSVEPARGREPSHEQIGARARAGLAYRDRLAIALHGDPE